jgi:hypothetical protein
MHFNMKFAVCERLIVGCVLCRLARQVYLHSASVGLMSQRHLLYAARNLQDANRDVNAAVGLFMHMTVEAAIGPAPAACPAACLNHIP